MVGADKYLKSFVIGSSMPVFMNFFLSVQNIQNRDPQKSRYTYEQYTIVAPLYLGFMNMIALYVGNTFGLSLRQRLLVISLISAAFVAGLAKLNVSYQFTDREWLDYFAWILLKHLFTYNVLIYLLEVTI